MISAAMDLKHISHAPRAVAHIVAHQVCYSSRVTVVVLRLHLAHHVRPHVGGLGVNTAAELHKESNKTDSEPIPDGKEVSGEVGEEERNVRRNR